MSVKLPTTGSEVAFDLDPLARAIDPSRSTHEVKSMKIEFKLAKAESGIRWSKLEGDEEATSGPSASMSAPVATLQTHNKADP